jgi:hypothetical protein
MGLLSRLFGTSEPRDLLADLVEAYRSEAAQAARLRQHAEHARYAQVATAMRDLAEIEDRHAGWLRDAILARNGGVPPVAPVPPVARNQWERAVASRLEAQRKRRRLVELFTRWDPDERNAADLLRRIEREDGQALSSYEQLVMRSDPHALD